MIFTVLGSGTSIPDAERGPAGFLVQAGDRAWLVDGGSGTIRQCARAGVDPRGLAGGLFSHLHPDHCADLAPLLSSMRIPPHPRTEPYPIWAGPGLEVHVRSLRALHGDWVDPEAGRPLVHELSDQGEDSIDLGPLRVVSAPAVHSPGALHLRFEADGVAVVYSGDTAPSTWLARLARGADLVVCECAGTDAHPLSGHLTPSAVAEVVAAALPDSVWLTHLYPEVDPERALHTVARAGRPVRHAHDLDRWEGTR